MIKKSVKFIKILFYNYKPNPNWRLEELFEKKVNRPGQVFNKFRREYLQASIIVEDKLNFIIF